VLLGQLGQIELEADAAADADAAFDPAAQQLTDDDASRSESDGQREWLETQVERYQYLLERHPSWSDMRVRCGMLLKLLGRPDDAAACFEQAARDNPGYAEAWVQLGLVKHQVGDVRGAIDALEMAIQIKPDYADLHYRLGLIYCGEAEFDLAMERLEQAVQLNGQNPDFQRQLLVALQSMQMNGRRPAAGMMGERVEPMSREAA
jgi:tetratricopeptide (TPR) repeat protein